MTHYQDALAVKMLRLRQSVAGRIPFSKSTSSAKASEKDLHNEHYNLTRSRTFGCAAIAMAPPHWREPVAELLLRREGAPGPASDHVFQYQLGRKTREGDAHAPQAAVAKGADMFYERQYRQYLNATMGVFAMTARLALLGCGGQPRGAFWSRRRSVHGAMIGAIAGASPIIVLDHQTVAIPLLLPTPTTPDEATAIDGWLAGDQPMPPSYRDLVQGDEICCATDGERARTRAAVGAVLEVVDAVRKGGKLAVLALHSYDRDAMGLHITLFATEALTAEAVHHDYTLVASELDPWRSAAGSQQRLLRFLVGGIEETFTQCSQNLFIKRPALRSTCGRRATWPHAWSSSQRLDRLIASQFELLQVTVSASGLPGASPRNGDIGKTAVVAQRGGNSTMLVPYFAGNALHRHSAKLWSNPQGAIVIWDDHTALSAVTIKGRSRVVDHRWIERRFPQIARDISARHKRHGSQAPDPEYGFEQEVSEIIQQDEPLFPSILDPARPTCSIHAAGLALHAREAEGRPKDPTGVSRRYWEWESAPLPAQRLTHLACLEQRV